MVPQCQASRFVQHIYVITVDASDSENAVTVVSCHTVVSGRCSWWHALQTLFDEATWMVP